MMLWESCLVRVQAECRRERCLLMPHVNQSRRLHPAVGALSGGGGSSYPAPTVVSMVVGVQRHAVAAALY